MLFEADPDFIAGLDDKTLVRLLKRLVLSESRLAGIPLRGAAVPLQITIADGGEDGRVEWNGGQSSTAYLPSRFTAFQSKAQNLTESRVRDEVLKVAKAQPPELSSVIRDVLARKGAYVIFCRERMVTAKRAKLVKAIRSAITTGGGDPSDAAAMEVYDANLIADWVNTHPAVALWLASQRMGRNLAGFQTHEAWGQVPDFNSAWKSSEEPRFAPVNRVVPLEVRADPKRSAWTYEQAAEEILQFLSSEKAIVRVFGPSGYGKSRFTFEVLGRTSTFADEIDRSSVIYTDGSISGEECVKLALELATTGFPAILVVDECADDLHNKLASIAARNNSRLRLVTLDIETKVLQANNTLSVRVEKSDDKLIGEIAKSIAPSLSDGDTRFITEIAEGFPSMAVLAAQQDADSRQTLVSAEQVLDRIIWSGKQRVADAQRVLEIASLFEWLGLQGRVESQAGFLAAELAHVPAPLFVEHLLSFTPRGIISQRGDFVQVGPTPLAARLGLARLSVMTAEQLVHFFKTAPSELQASLLKRIKWMDTSPTAVAFAERLLQPEMFGNFAALNTEFGSKALDRLVHVAPDLVSATIDRVFGHLTIEELKVAHDGHRHLVWALEKLVFRAQTFERSAHLLMKLAAAENENYGNNASGIFKQLYQLYLSGTEAAPAARLLVLDDGLASTSEAERRVCVDALGHMLDSQHYSRGGGAEQIGSAEAIEDWRPKTYGEIHDFFRAAVSRLTDIAVSNDVCANVAQAHLASHIRGLLRDLPSAEVKAMIDKVVRVRGFWPEALMSISDWLYFDREKGTPATISKEVRGMYDALLPTDPVELAILYTQGWQVDLHDPDAKYDSGTDAKYDFDYGARQAISTARLIAADELLIKRSVERIACGDGHGTFAFSRELMKQVSDPNELMQIAVAVAERSETSPNRGFFGGLITGADDRDSELAKRLIRLALQSPKLKNEAVALIGSGRLQSDDIQLIISLLASADIQPLQCRNLGLARIDEGSLNPLLEELERHGNEGLWTILDVVDMYLYDNKNPVTKKLVDLIERVLVTPALMDAVTSKMDGYHMEQMVERLIRLGAISEPYAKKLSKQVMRICRQGTDRVFYDLDAPVRKILESLMALYPATVWAEITRKLTSKSWYDRFYAEHLLEAQHLGDDGEYLGRGLSFNVPPQVYMDWVREKQDARAAMAVSWLPIADKNDRGQLTWHAELEAFVAEFGNQADVLAAVSSRLLPTSYWGGLERYLEPLIPLIQSWSSHPNANIRRWVAEQLDRLNNAIAEERKRSEEDVVRYG
ncbi:hypothetical protein OSH11_23260 [Kaistia dalseonensis]|uniref:ATP-binding protein n=1 Tax=Kaistia dalseonensis TaxID=410840 RepID=A0ABU0HEK2_9HYPH|nr:hypothetical protein [Kaistia dalseonensis]MCX5497636.1 hypothetical protein [Kaistia dalseonensis]MDQ0440278.1 hypothetical protein [Kaistia dalseonensis]